MTPIILYMSHISVPVFAKINFRKKTSGLYDKECVGLQISILGSYASPFIVRERIL